MATMAMRQNPLPAAASSGVEIQSRMLALFRIPTHRWPATFRGNVDRQDQVYPGMQRGRRRPVRDVKIITINGRTEYHICGDLNLSGTGSLSGIAPTADSLIVIENGSLNVANAASVSVARMAIVMTGDNNVRARARSIFQTAMARQDN
jgi:hypothetical protein